MYTAFILIAIGLIYDVMTYFCNRSKSIAKQGSLEPGHEMGNWEQERTADEDDEDIVKVPNCKKRCPV